VSALSPLASWALFVLLWLAAIVLALMFARWANRPHPQQRMSDQWLRRHRDGQNR
jgi:hypothetical protein